MAREVSITVGELYANLHERFSENLGQEYEDTMRAEVEDYLHSLNKQLERQSEQAQAHDLEEELAAQLEEE